jgi:hypothetical protein
VCVERSEIVVDAIEPYLVTEEYIVASGGLSLKDAYRKPDDLLRGKAGSAAITSSRASAS